MRHLLWCLLAATVLGASGCGPQAHMDQNAIQVLTRVKTAQDSPPAEGLQAFPEDEAGANADWRWIASLDDLNAYAGITENGSDLCLLSVEADGSSAACAPWEDQGRPFLLRVGGRNRDLLIALVVDRWVRAEVGDASCLVRGNVLLIQNPPDTGPLTFVGVDGNHTDVDIPAGDTSTAPPRCA